MPRTRSVALPSARRPSRRAGLHGAFAALALAAGACAGGPGPMNAAVRSPLPAPLAPRALPQAGEPGAPPPYVVRFVYLVSADRPVRPDFARAIEEAARSVQRWYAAQLGGPTFSLSSPVVEVVRSQQKAAWFYAHPTGPDPKGWGFDNGLAEARRLLGAGHGQLHAWILYSDGPGNQGRGGAGVAVLPEDDLLGLVGQHPTQKSIARWQGGLGHELGHALGLPHPADQAKDRDAIMASGFYGGYPGRTYLTAEDKQRLARSRFIGRPEDRHPAQVLAVFRHRGGVLTRLRFGPRVEWVERNTGGAEYHFDERGKPGRFHLLEDDSRGFWLRVPVAGGPCELSRDRGATWGFLYELRRDP